MTETRIPCAQDPVGTECKPDCPNFTFNLQNLRRLANEHKITPQELARRIPLEGDRTLNLIASSMYLPKRLFRRCTEQPNIIRIVDLREKKV